MGYHGDAQNAQWLFRKQTVLRAGTNEPIDVSEPGGGLFERTDDWSSCAYFYLDRPDNDLPPLVPVKQRIAGLRTTTGPDKRLDV
jgi:hypothetical protein